MKKTFLLISLFLTGFTNEFGAFAQGLTFEMNASYATCDISPDGTATVTVFGGVHPMTYQWSDGQTFVVAYNLLPGDYSVTVTDANGLTGVGNVTVITGPETIWLMPSSTDATCDCNGTANPHAMLGIPPYSYAWSNGQTTEVATGLCPGNYTVTVTDQSGCANSADVTVSGYGKLTLDISSQDAYCGKNNGSATVDPTSGVAPYSIFWSNGQKTNTISNLATGNYSVTVIDAVGCSNTATTTVNNLDNLSVSISPENGSVCKGDKLQLTAITKDIVSYKWSSTGGNFDDNTVKSPNYTMNTPGTYTISVIIEAGGCTASASTTVTVEDRPDISMTSCADYSCTGEDIPMSINPNATSPGLTYMWSATGGSFSNTKGPATRYQNSVPGVYIITLMGIDPDGGCPAIDTKKITVLNLSSSLTIDTPLSACGETDAKISASVSGGLGKYSYEWSNGVVNQTYIDGIGAGTYSVTITDIKSRCKTVSSINVHADGIHIGDYVWYDSNENCMQDAGESGVAAVPVLLVSPGYDGIVNTDDDWIVETQYTDEYGYYQFDCVAIGTYYIHFQVLALLPDYEFTCQNGYYYDIDSDANPATGNTEAFTVSIGDNEYDIDAGIIPICRSLQHGGKICCSQEICAGETPDLLTNVISASGMSAKPIEYLWMKNTKPGLYDIDDWTIIPNSNYEDWNPGPVFQTTFFIRCARSQGCTHYNVESNIVTIKVVGCGLQINDNKQTGNVSIPSSINMEKEMTLNTSRFVVYPNPAVSYINIDVALEKDQTGTIDIYDISGKRHNKTIHFADEATSHTLNIEELPKGIYILKFQYENGDFEIQKFVKL